MSAGNTLAEAQVQCLSEIFERAVKREILEGEIACLMCRKTCWQSIPASWLAYRAWKNKAFRCWSKTLRWAGNIR
jgi:ribosomal protein S12 methylthiotransferase accessory factor YcaO